MSELSDQEPYRAALSLALETRYQEAAVKLSELLREHPQHVPSLILLGKVEYYLRRFSSSRLRFEQALSLEPANPAAWFGLQYYVQRRRTVLLLGVLGIWIGVFALAGILFLGSVRRSMASDLKGTEERLSGRLLELERSVAGEQEARERSDKALRGNVAGLSETLERHASGLKAIERRLDTAFTAVSGRLEELADLQTELNRELRADIRELRNKIGELRAVLQSATGR